MNLYQAANGAMIGQAQDMIGGTKPVDLVLESDGGQFRNEYMNEIDEMDD